MELKDPEQTDYGPVRFSRNSRLDVDKAISPPIFAACNLVGLTNHHWNALRCR